MPLASVAGALRGVAGLLDDSEARIDMQVETPFGAFALREWLRTGGAVLLKTSHGPVLTNDAWSKPAFACAAARQSPMAA